MSSRRPRPPGGRGQARRRRRRRIRLLVAGALAILAAVAVLAVVLFDRKSVPGGLPVVKGNVGLVAPKAIPTSYRLVYAISTWEAPPSTEEVKVTRPYLGSDIIRSKGGIVTGVLTNAKGVWSWTNGKWLQDSAGRQRAAGDYYVLPALRWAVAHGDAKIRGAGTVLGRPCTVVRTGSPVGSQMTAPTTSSFDDICVDASGVELADKWVDNGRVLRVRKATVYDTHPDFGPATFDAVPAAASPGPAGLASPSTPLPASAFSSLPVHLVPPAGFLAEDGFARLPSSGGVVSTAPSYTEHFVDGVRMFDLQVGSVDPSFQPQGTPVALPLGRAAINVQLQGSNLEVVLPGGEYVSLQGPDPTLLIAAAKGLGVGKPTG